MKQLGFRQQESMLKEAFKVLEFYQSLQNSKKVKDNHDKEKRKLLNSQLYSGMQMFRYPEGNNRERDWKMQQAMLGGGNNPFQMMGGKGFMF